MTFVDPLTPPTGQAQADQANAVAILTNELTSWGFGSDAITWATQAIQSNAPPDQVLFDLRNQPFYKNSIYGQTSAARAKAGLTPLTERQILDYKTTLQGVAQQAGLPQNFITDNEITTLLGFEVSAPEAEQRILQGYVAAQNAPADVRQQLHDYYGIDTGHLAAYYLDPQRAYDTVLKPQLQAAQLGAAATRTGFGAIDVNTAQGLAQLGVTEAQGQRGFTDLAKQSQLFAPLPGSAEAAIGTPVQLAAEFGGSAPAEQEITQREEQRKATFSGGYRYAESQRGGISGLGPVTRAG